MFTPKLNQCDCILKNLFNYNKRAFYTKPGKKRNLPNLIYLQNPMKWLRNKIDFKLLKYAWDPQFGEQDFKRGAKQAIVLLTKLIKDQELNSIHELTTKNGYKQISRDLILSRNDPRLQLLMFRPDDIQRTIPVKIHFMEKNDKRHCFVDMFFVGVRYFDNLSTTEQQEVMCNLLKYEELYKKKRTNENISTDINVNKMLQKMIFAEIFARFHRDYSAMKSDHEWNVSFYKVATFDIINIKSSEI